MVGPSPPDSLAALKSAMCSGESVDFLSDIADECLADLYSETTIFLFPSIAEGFGWPIMEAIASGCPVITTGETLMTEVVGNASVLIAVAAFEETEASEPWTTPWAATAATALAQVAGLSDQGRREIVAGDLARTRHFDSTVALDRIEAIYSQLFSQKAFFVQNTLSH